MSKYKKLYSIIIPLIVICFTLYGQLFAGDSGANGGDASNSMAVGAGTEISTGIYTGDLGPGDTTDRYRINAVAGETLACTVTKTGDVSVFSVSIWDGSGGEPNSYYIMTSVNNVNTACITTHVIIGGNFVLGMLLGNDKIACSYEFTVTRSTQNDAGTGRDAGSLAYLRDGSYTGYVDGGDTIDRYPILAVVNPFIKLQVTTPASLKANIYLLE